MKRRQFLRATPVAAVAAAGAASLYGRRASAQPFGDPIMPSYSKVLLPPAARSQNILECFLYGGLTLWESFYCVKEYGTADDPEPSFRNTQLYTFFNAKSTKLVTALKACGTLAPDGDLFSLVKPFAKDALGAQVNFGPLLPLFSARPDLVARTRLVVNRHDLEPHEAAIPFAMCGRRLGSPTMASLGAHIQRWALEHDTTNRRSPFSYAFASNYFPSDNVRATVANGVHPGSARPLFIKVDDASRLTSLIARGTVGEHRAEYDALLDVYVQQYRDRLKFAGAGMPLRSPKLGDVAQGAASVRDADAVAKVFDPALFTKVTDTFCGDTNLNVPAMSLRLATHLLTHPTEPARWCCFVDPGLKTADGGGGYDTHAENSHTQARNFTNFLTYLLKYINAPGENDPAKIDLDKTMIVLNMEFGRSPTAQDGGQGRNHWPYGYVQIYIGGSIGPAQAGIYGAIGPDGYAPDGMYTTPAENRIACLLAMGIWPFSPDAFGVGDVQNVSNEIDAVVSVTQRVLGHTEVTA